MISPGCLGSVRRTFPVSGSMMDRVLSTPPAMTDLLSRENATASGSSANSVPGLRGFPLAASKTRTWPCHLVMQVATQLLSPENESDVDPPNGGDISASILDFSTSQA